IPEIFWSEPLLQPLYNAIRTYLEISQHVKVLNDKCNAINDLLDMLHEDIVIQT
ncbi:15900_t:CDS:2, partial [Entrophospora sp. SA101]